MPSREERVTNIARVQARVGTSWPECLSWAIRFAQQDAGAMSAGEWFSRREEVSAFAANSLRSPEGLERWRRRWQLEHPEDFAPPILFSEPDARAVHQEFARIIRELLENNQVEIGRYEVSFHLQRWQVILGSSRRPVLLQHVLPRGVQGATYTLGNLLGVYGHLVKRCDAPGLRSSDECGQWFLARRLNQFYCSARCHSRATTKANREGQKLSHPPATLPKAPKLLLPAVVIKKTRKRRKGR